MANGVGCLPSHRFPRELWFPTTYLLMPAVKQTSVDTGEEEGQVHNWDTPWLFILQEIFVL